MGKPYSADQCITLDPQENKILREAWGRNPQQGQTVYVVEKGAVEVQEYTFARFTLCGMKLLWESSSGRSFECQKYWKHGTQLFTDIQAARLVAYMNGISNIAKLKIELEAESKRTDILADQLRMSNNDS